MMYRELIEKLNTAEAEGNTAYAAEVKGILCAGYGYDAEDAYDAYKAMKWAIPLRYAELKQEMPADYAERDKALKDCAAVFC